MLNLVVIPPVQWRLDTWAHETSCRGESLFAHWLQFGLDVPCAVLGNFPGILPVTPKPRPSILKKSKSRALSDDTAQKSKKSVCLHSVHSPATASCWHKSSPTRGQSRHLPFVLVCRKYIHTPMPHLILPLLRTSPKLAEIGGSDPHPAMD